jgi:hypothetical protein
MVYLASICMGPTEGPEDSPREEFMRNCLTVGFLLLSASCVIPPRWAPSRADVGAPSFTDPYPMPSATLTPAVSIRQREEYAVYETILGKFFEAGALRCIVLKDFTTARHLIEEDSATLDYVRENLPEMPQDVWADFISRNQIPVALKPVFHFAVPIVLISQEEINRIFFAQEGDGWKRFYDMYPGAQGIMDVSQAGFNPEWDRALVYTGDQSHYLAGIGLLYYLEKAGGNWNIRNSVMVWIS